MMANLPHEMLSPEARKKIREEQKKMSAHKNHRHPIALQAEVRKQLFADGKIDKHGNSLREVKPAPPPPPPKPRPNMLMTGSMVERKGMPASKPVALSPEQKLETLPDTEIIAKATTLNLNVEGASRETLIKSLLDAGAEG